KSSLSQENDFLPTTTVLHLFNRPASKISPAKPLLLTSIQNSVFTALAGSRAFLKVDFDFFNIGNAFVLAFSIHCSRLSLSSFSSFSSLSGSSDPPNSVSSGGRGPSTFSKQIVKSLFPAIILAT